ncbi:NAD(P)H-hydrate dehydratase [uncultured Citricoccus sp.]|uniref:NAD(P)H-hydrate dehydratase n=1 Tax=uncultured Citricoccus sp. TaxID=614031 RepID=UPI002635FB12|nr:NAD(P)H-hydrate dehydratase [uncultured Citricoccus sp.]
MTAIRAVARELGAVVLLKGPTTVCAALDGHTVVQNEGGPELATAGSGDTLAGLVGSGRRRSPPPSGQCWSMPDTQPA